MRIALVVLVVLSVFGVSTIGFAAGGAAAPPPTQLCGVCHGDLEGATGPGTLEIHVDGDGDAEWVERVPVTPTTAERYEANASLLDETVSEAWARYHVTAVDGSTPVTDDGVPRDLSSAVEDGAVVVTYPVENVARPGVGDTWIVDYLYEPRDQTRYHIGGERLTIHPPDGYVMTNAPGNAERIDGALVWTGQDPGNFESDFGPETLVTYAPDDGVLATASSYATIGQLVGPLLVFQTGLASVLPVAILGVGALAVVRLRPDSRVLGDAHARFVAADLDRIQRLCVAASAVGLATALVWTVLTRVPAVDLAVGSAAYAALALAASELERRRGGRGLFAGVLAVTLGAAVTAWLLGWALWVGGIVLALAAFLPLGYAIERGRRVRLPLALVLLGPAVATASIAPFRGFGLLVYAIAMVPTTVFVVAVGYPLSVLGRRLAIDRISARR